MKGGIKSKSRVTPSSSIRDLSSFAPQLSLFGGRGAVGNGFGIRARGGVGGGGDVGGLSDIFEAMQMDQLPLYVSTVFGRGGGSSGGSGLRGRVLMHPRRSGGWRRGQQWRGTSSLSYMHRSKVGGRCGHMLSRAHLNRGGGIFCCWWKHTM